MDILMRCGMMGILWSCSFIREDVVSDSVDVDEMEVVVGEEWMEQGMERNSYEVQEEGEVRGVEEGERKGR